MPTHTTGTSSAGAAYAAHTPSIPTIKWSSIRMGAKIGQGGFGEVFVGDWSMGAMGTRQVAVKKMLDTILTADLKRDFYTEGGMHYHCEHPAIVKLFGIIDAPDQLALVLEYLPKGSLYQSLSDASVDLPWPVRWQVAVDMSTGLAYLHGHKILHRDLKSMNVLLDDAMHAKLTDFGLAKVKTHTQAVTNYTDKGKAKGSLRWRAPETFKRKYAPSELADVYSLGMTLWELATRALPYADESDDQVVLGWIKDGDLEDIPEDCPEAFAVQIKRCWAKEPTDRPKAAALAAALEASRPQPLGLASDDDGSSGEKSWHFSSNQRGFAHPDKGYELFEAGQLDHDKVIAAYWHTPVPGYDIKKVEVIHNPYLNRSFADRLHLLQSRAGNPAFHPRWPQEGTASQQTQRQAIDRWHRDQSQVHADSDVPEVRLMPMWHGTKPEILESIFKTGYANLATTDSGFFGKGIYNSHEAEYAYRVYATSNYLQTGGLVMTGALVMNWVCSHSAYPVIDGDMAKLQTKGNYQNYDAHLIPVRPKNPANPKEVNYYPCKADTPPTYHELVVFETASVLPRYLVHLQPSMPKSPSIKVPLPASGMQPPSKKPSTPKAKTPTSAPKKASSKKTPPAEPASHAPSVSALGAFKPKGGLSHAKAATGSATTSTTSTSVQPALKQAEVDAFVQLVMDGEQDKADAMLKQNPALALGKGKGTEKSGRKWQGITGFQFAVWALDWRMWVMIRGHMEKAGYSDHVRRQFAEQESLSTQQGHGAHFDFEPLLKAYDRYKGYHEKKKWFDCEKCFVKEIGGAQRLLPVHVAQEYCTPDRPFDPLPNFSATSITRALKVWWFTKNLGSQFATARGGSACVCVSRALVWGPGRGDANVLLIRCQRVPAISTDSTAVSELSRCRTAQLEALQTQLGFVDAKKQTELAANQSKKTDSKTKQRTTAPQHTQPTTVAHRYHSSSTPLAPAPGFRSDPTPGSRGCPVQ